VTPLQKGRCLQKRVRLKGAKEALGDGVIEAIADRAHGGYEPDLRQPLPKGGRGVRRTVV
jgi:hypothetical protein